MLANNLPVASGVVVVNRNRIAVEVKQMLPRETGRDKRFTVLVPPSPICYMGGVDPADAGHFQRYPPAAVAELVDALA